MNNNLFPVVLAAACACGAHATSDKQIVRRLYEECINPSRYELLPELVAADYTGPTGESGPPGFEKLLRGLKAGVPDIHFTVEELVGEPGHVAVRWRWTGTHSGTFQGLAPSHKAVINQGVAIYELRDGKIVRGSVLTDRLGFLQQIGLVSPELGAPPPPPKGR